MSYQPTAIIYLAAPTGKRLAIVGLNGDWATHQGSFELIQEMDSGFGIFMGTIPIPSYNSPFKFVQLESDGTMKYEGENPSDNRNDELLPDAMYFFVFQPRKDGFLKKAGKAIAEAFGMGKPEIRQKILAEFIKLAFNRALKEASFDWDATIDIMRDCLKKLNRLKCKELLDCFRKFVVDCLQRPEFQGNFDPLLLLIIGSYLTGSTFPDVLKEFLLIYAVPFSLYLYHFKDLKRNNDIFANALETLAAMGGPNYYWIYFHIDRSKKIIKENPKGVREALIQTMRDIPVVFFSKQETITGVIFYLLRFNDIDDIYDRLFTFLQDKPDYKRMINGLFFKALLERKRTVDEATRIICSKFLIEVETFKSADDGSLKVFFEILFDRELSDVVKLANNSPDHLIRFVKPVVQTTILKKMEGLTQFKYDDYHYFAQLDTSKQVHFRQAFRMIDEVCIRMSKEHVRSGDFQNVPCLKLILRSLAEMDPSVPFLERPSLVDLQNAVNKMPRRFFQNLHTVLKSTTLPDKNLKAHRKGETKNTVERIEGHLDVMEDIVVKIKNRRIALNEITCLDDVQVVDYLKYLDIGEREMEDIGQQVEELKKRQNIYGGLYNKFGRYNCLEYKEHCCIGLSLYLLLVIRLNKVGDEIQILEPKEWKTYLNDIDIDQSVLLLQNAINLPTPLTRVEAEWLEKVQDCTSFMEMVWYPSVERTPKTPFVRDNLSSFINYCAAHWLQMAQRVIEGSVPFLEMEKILRLQPDHIPLARHHLQQERPVELVFESYRDFKIL